MIVNNWDFHIEMLLSDIRNLQEDFYFKYRTTARFVKLPVGAVDAIIHAYRDILVLSKETRLPTLMGLIVCETPSVNYDEIEVF